MNKNRLQLGRSQVVRQRILIPPYGGSNPPAPATQSQREHALGRGPQIGPIPRHSRRVNEPETGARGPEIHLFAARLCEALRRFAFG